MCSSPGSETHKKYTTAHHVYFFLRLLSYSTFRHALVRNPKKTFIYITPTRTLLHLELFHGNPSSQISHTPTHIHTEMRHLMQSHGGLTSILAVLILILFMVLVRLLTAWWILPLLAQRKLRKNGFGGPTPSFPLGSIIKMKKRSNVSEASLSKQLITHDIHSTVFPYFAEWQKLHGESSESYRNLVSILNIPRSILTDRPKTTISRFNV